MKILIIPSWYIQKDNPISGVFFREQALALQEQGIEVFVMYLELKSWKKILKSRKIFEEQIFLDEGMPTYRKSSSLYIPRFINSYLSQYKKMSMDLMEKIIREHGRPDAIHAHATLYGGWIGAQLSKKYNIPLVITEHSSAYSRNLILEKQIPYIKEALNQAASILAVGEGLIKELEKYTTKEIKYMPNIVDINIAPKYELNLKKDKEKFVFFTLSLLSKNKCVDNIIKAFVKVAEIEPKVELWIGGSGEELINLKKLVKQFKLEQRVLFLGMLDREQVFQKMNECDTFISASEVETFGVVLIEALSAGKPIIATKSGGPNLIVNQDNGLLVKVNDIDELAKALLQIKKNYKIYNSAIIKEDCKNKYSKEVVCQKLISLYEEII